MQHAQLKNVSILQGRLRTEKVLMWLRVPLLLM